MALDLPLNLFHASYDLDVSWIYDEEELSTVIKQLQNDWTIKNIQSTMVKDVINELEKQYTRICASERDVNKERRDKNRVIAYTDCLSQGIKPKIYTPLMKRDTCSSLEDRINHYAKRRKINTDSTS